MSIYQLDPFAPGRPHDSDAASREIPDLDAGVPLLRSSEAQRLNRKALAFLGAIVMLLVASAAWMFSGLGERAPASSRATEKIVIPELPSARGSDESNQAPSAPIPLADASIELPPIPASAAQQAASAPPSTTLQMGSVAHAPTLVERREGVLTEIATPNPADPYTQALLAGMPPPPQGAPRQTETPPVRDDASDARSLQHPNALLARGSYIRCVLETRIVTDIPGFTSCVVTEPVYSVNGRGLLLPKGSKVSGRYEADANGPRIAVVWDRITTPEGVDVRMASPGVDNLGGAGHPGEYDAHWPARVGAALMISIISDVFKYEGQTHGPRTTTVSNGLVTQAPFESNTARTMERLANIALDRSVSRPATVTINQGEVVNIYVARDVDFSSVLAR